MEFHPLAGDKVAASSKGWWHTHPGLPSRVGQKPLALSAEQLASFDRDGFLLIKAKDIWTEAEIKLLKDSVKLIEDWKDAPGKYMKYYEKNRHNPSEKILCRIENFAQYNPGLDYILRGEKLIDRATDLFNSQSILYKEKINFKLPGGDGFAPHQDLAAGWWMYNQKLHISCLVSVDPATPENGCLEAVAGKHLDGMCCDDWKEIPKENCDKFVWQTIPTQPGDVLFFDSYVPHRSGPNDTNTPRKIMYATYARANEGDLRDKYYADKRLSFPPDCERESGKVYEYKI